MQIGPRGSVLNLVVTAPPDLRMIEGVRSSQSVERSDGQGKEAAGTWGTQRVSFSKAVCSQLTLGLRALTVV